MSCDNTNDLCVKLGETFSAVFYWTKLPLISKVITGISKATPVVITAVGHGLLSGSRAAVVSAGGMIQINAREYPPEARDWHTATVLTADTVQFNEVSSAGMTAYTSGGALVYETPASLAGASAVMTIRDAPGGTVLLVSPIGITLALDDTAKTITATFETAALTWTVGFYDLEVTDAAGKITQVSSGELAIN